MLLTGKVAKYIQETRNSLLKIGQKRIASRKLHAFTYQVVSKKKIGAMQSNQCVETDGT